jgi:hypothetical protein
MELFIRRVGALLGTVRALYRQIINRYFGKIQRFDGDARQIGEQIIERVWQGDFYRTSLGHYDFFWMRDFGTVANSLVQLGNKDKVQRTLNWALLHYMKANHVTQCLDRNGNAFNAPAKKSVDALPWLLHSLAVSNYQLHPLERKFLNERLAHYTDVYLLPDGDLKQNVHFAELRDAVNYDRSAYAIALIARLSVCAKELDLKFDFTVETYQTILKKQYWNGKFFKADRSTNVYSSESALMPFFHDIITDKKMVEATMDYITDRKLNKPYPLQYGEHSEKFHYRPTMNNIVMPQYTGNTLWTWHATFYLHVLHRYKRAEYAENYHKFAELIERHGTYPELVNHDGSWYKAPFYMADPGMVWVALFLELPKPKH